MYNVHVLVEDWLPATNQAPQLARRLIGRLPEVHADSYELALVTSELVTNAVRHAALGDTDRVRVRVETVADWVRLDVCESGPGFVESFPARDSPGGWGLVLVGELADRWGAARRNGEFCVWAEIGEPRTLAPTPGVRPCVIVAEDDHEIASLLELRLARLGCDTHLACDGGRALELIEAVEPDLAILNVRMPVLDGMTVLQRVRSRQNLVQPLVLFVTGNGRDADVSRARTAGADGFVIKPFLGEALDDEITALLRRGPTGAC